MKLRDLPSVDELARSSDDPLAVQAARIVLARAREEIQAGAEPGDLAERVCARSSTLLATARLRRALNATGVIVHTNLGRAPLAEAALERVHEVGRGYSNLEYDLSAGARGSRQDHVAGVLRRLTGAEAALVVNNNAAAVLLALAALAEGREVIVSRGELIEIGDGFRIPDVLARSGRPPRRGRDDEPHPRRRLRAGDRPETAVLLRVHQSNFRVVGFTELPSVARAGARSRSGTSCRSSTTSARARSRRSRTSRRCGRASRPAPTSSASRATSCSAARRRESWSAAPSSSRSCAGIRCSARCARTS